MNANYLWLSFGPARRIATGIGEYREQFSSGRSGREPAGSGSGRGDRLKESHRRGEEIENHCAAVALGYLAYNFIKVHRTFRMTPAMAAGVSTRLGEASDLAAAFGAYQRERERRVAAQAVQSSFVDLALALEPFARVFFFCVKRK